MLAHLISRTRRNHGLEHATIHVLSEKHKNFSAQGNSTHTGFNLNIYGDLTDADITAAVSEAYSRMKNGEHHLAVHPNCGTVFLTTATMATLAAQATFGLEQKRNGRATWTMNTLLNTLPAAILAVFATLVISRPIGIQLQARYTVEGDLKDMEIVAIEPVSPSPITWLFQMMLTGGKMGMQAKSYRITTTG